MAPVAKRLTHTVKFGRTDATQPENYMSPPIEHNDPYFWIRDDTRQSEEVLKLLEQENEWTKDFMKSTEDKREQLYQLYKSRTPETYDSCPYPKWTYDSPYMYFFKTIKDKGYPIYYRKKRTVPEPEPELLLDINALAEGHNQCDVNGPKINSDHTIMAYGVDYKGDEYYKYHFIRISDGTELPIALPPLKSGITMLKYSNDIIYEEHDSADRNYRIWHLNWTTGQKTMIYEDLDQEYSVGYQVSSQDDYLLVYSGGANCEEVRIFPIDPCGKLGFTEQVKISRDYGLKFNSLNIQSKDCVYVVSTYGDPSRYSLFKTTLANLSDPDNWILMQLPDSNSCSDVNYSSITVNYLIVNIRYQGVSRNYRATHTDPLSWVEVTPSDYDESKGVLIGHITTYYESNNAFYCYTTAVVPNTVVVLNLDTLQTTPYYTKSVPNYNQDLYESRRTTIKVRDGTHVPVTISKRRDVKGPAPVYLYGYGSYGITIEPTFKTSLFTILDQGFIHVTAHVRGGGMLGESWHLAGKMYNKLNTFYDFIDVAEHLRDNKVASKIVAEGRSAGGMLMGVVYTMRPDLFDCVIAGVPFVDCLTTMQDSTIPLTCGEWKHWGNTNIQKDYEYILKYSPYDNIKSQSQSKIEYPPLLMLSGLHDRRVAYWEPAKFVSKLRYLNPDLSHVYLKTELERGHFGDTDRYRYLREQAHDLAFVLKVIS